MNRETKIYEEETIDKFFRWSFIIVFSFSLIIIIPVFVRDAIRDYNQNNWEDFIIGSIFLALCPFGIWMIVELIIEFFTVAIKIELTNEKIIGYPRYGKKRFVIRYDEIESIKDRSSVYPQHAITLTGNGKKILISVRIYPLADIVEEIESRAINLKKRELDDLKSNRRLWVRGKEK